MDEQELMRRRRVLRVPYDAVLGLLMEPRLAELNEVLAIRHFNGVPATARVLSVHECYDSRSFAFVLVDPSFDVVEDAVAAPSFPYTGVTQTDVRLHPVRSWDDLATKAAA